MERRRDPYDGKTQTLQEMVKKYQGTYSKSEVESYFEFECTAVTAVASVPASAPAPKAASNEIEGLRHWLKEKGRESQFDQVSSWCEENGRGANPWVFGLATVGNSNGILQHICQNNLSL